MTTLGKAAFATPMYLSVAWILMTSYRLFTQTAVTTVVTNINIFSPSVGLWLASRLDMIVFITAFAWVFVLSSAIPGVILGKERGVLIQFFVCLTLTFLSFVILDVLQEYFAISMNQLFQLAFLFNNPILATLYLSIPYIFMVVLDIRSRRKNKQKKDLEILTETYLEDVENEEVIETAE